MISTEGPRALANVAKGALADTYNTSATFTPIDLATHPGELQQSLLLFALLNCHCLFGSDWFSLCLFGGGKFHPVKYDGSCRKRWLFVYIGRLARELFALAAKHLATKEHVPACRTEFCIRLITSQTVLAQARLITASICYHSLHLHAVVRAERTCCFVIPSCHIVLNRCAGIYLITLQNIFCRYNFLTSVHLHAQHPILFHFWFKL